MAELTDKEKIALLKQAFPGISDKAIKADLPYIKTAKDVQYIIDNSGVLPNQGTLKGIFKGVAKKAELPGTFWMEHPMGGEVMLGGNIAKSLIALGKSVFRKKAAEEGAKQAAKMSLKKKAAIGAVTLYGGSQAAGSIANRMGGNQPDTTTAQSQSEIDTANAIAAADAAGIDVNSIINSTAGQQLNLNADNIQAFMAKFGYNSSSYVGLGNVGVFTGTETKGTKTGPKGIVYPTSKKEIVSLAEWNKRFPSDAAGLAAAKQKFVNAGVLSPTDGIERVKSAWEAYGKMSLEYSRAGNALSPWQILDMQKGLSGSGSQTSVTIDTSPMAEADIRLLAKRQLAQSLGLSNIDDKMYKDILKIVRKNEALKPTKTVVTQVGTKTTRKTTPGYGQSDVLADIENYAKQDPRYSEFQTANVFGDALVKALGLKA